MYTREIEVLTPKSIGDSGTETVDIDVLEPFTKLDIMFYLENDTSILDNTPPQSIISAIEIVDGGRTWWSLTGEEAFAYAAYELGHFPKQWLMSMASLSSRIRIPIRFGRYLGDPQYGFNPQALRNPQLKVTWSKNSGHLASSLDLGVFGTVMEGGGAPSQCLMARSIRRFVSASSGDENTDLWVDNPYRRLFVKVGANTASVWGVISQFKLTANEKITLFDLSYEEFRELCEENWGLFFDHQFIDADNSTYTYSRLGNVEAGAIQAGDGGIIVSPWYNSSPAVFLAVENSAGGAVSNKDTNALFIGSLPEMVYCYPFGRADDPATWLPAQEFATLKLLLTQATASQTIGIFVQQPVTLGMS